MEKLDSLFSPKTIAIIGAGTDRTGVGHSIFTNLIGSGYEGIVYPVNTKRRSVQGVEAYPSIEKIPDRIDLAVIATPALTVPGLVEDCGRTGVRNLVIVSAGFKEAGGEGKAMYETIAQTARRYDMRVLGPNCLGFIKPSAHLNVSFADRMPLPGRIAFISQSGALCTSVLDWAVKQNVGFSHFVSIGETVDIGFHDLIDYFGTHGGTSSILIYMESLTDARKFLSAARAFARTKPIIVLKAGKTSGGAKAALSHTGSLAGDDMVFGAAFKRAGMVRVNEIGELFDCAKTLSMQRLPLGNRLAIVTNAGGPGVIATDYLLTNGGDLAALSEDTIRGLDASLPAAWSRGNPIDVLGDAGPDRFRDAVKLCLSDPGVDGILVILTPQTMTEPAEVARELVGLQDTKPILASWMGEDAVQEGVEVLDKGSVPVYRTPEEAVRSFLYMHQYSKNLKLLSETPATIPHAFVPKTAANRQLIQELRANHRTILMEHESKQLLANYGIPVTKDRLVHSANEAGRAAAELGFPVVLKIASPDIMHKTDVGGVKLSIENKSDAERAYTEIVNSVQQKAPKANIAGVLVERMEHKQYELLIGSKKDPIFGPVIVFGMGGVAVEVYKDTNVALPPLNMGLSLRLIEETKIYKLLKGYRGMKAVDVSAIQFLLYKFAYLVMDFPDIKEVDINPFVVDESGGVVLDAKIVLDDALPIGPLKPYSHMVISPYPKEYVSSFSLKDGSRVVLRPIRPEDEPMEAEMFTKFSERTQQYRFFQLIKDISHELMIRFTQIDYDREIAIVGELRSPEGPKMVGVARIIADGYNETAEFAIVVADPWQYQGLGSKLTDFVLKLARKRGLKKIFAEMLNENTAMIHILEKRGFKITQREGNCHAELVIT
jgi:acetyltransferase